MPTPSLPRPRIAVTTAHALVGSAALARQLAVDAVVHLGSLPARHDAVCVVSPPAGAARADAARFAQNRGIPLWVVGRGPLRPDDLAPEAIRRDPFSFRLERLFGGASGPEPRDATAAREASIVRVLENTSGTDPLGDPALLARARAAMAYFVSARLSSDERGLDAEAPIAVGTRRVLVVADDRPGMAREVAASRLNRMLARALELAPVPAPAVRADAPGVGGVLLRDTAGLRHDPSVHGLLADARIVAVPDGLRPTSLFDVVDHVVVGDSELGLEALLHGKTVTCLGSPAYAGFGLTRDEDIASRARARTVVELFAAAFLVDTHYVDPETGAPTDLERALAHLALQRRHAEPFGTVFNGIGFSPWKRTFVPAFLAAPPNQLVFDARSTTPDGPLPFGAAAREIRVVWGPRDVPPPGANDPVATRRMEDGFLRSVGLGSDFHTPASLVVDSRGIYFDPSAPSDLEWILETADFDDAERMRASRLRERIVRLGVSKYNVGARAPFVLPDAAAGRRKVLVVGQVEDDASIRLGCLATRTNAALLEAARAACPDAFVVWKPHPDVASGNRQGAVPAALVARVANLVVTDVAVGECLAVVDEVHTMTSLVGFEALLRGLRVAVHGQPFYAGWGLTEDLFPHPRRTRRRTLDELVAATLIRYPRYVHPTSGELSTPEAIVDHLVAARGALAAKSPTTGSKIDGWIRAVKLVVMARAPGGRRGR